QLPPMQETATRINDVGDVTLALILIRLDQRLTQATDDSGGTISIKQECADAIFPHRPHAVAEHEPAGFRFDRGAAIPQLDEFPGELRLQDKPRGIPEMQVVREH